jgi:hypothetical protein
MVGGDLCTVPSAVLQVKKRDSSFPGEMEAVPGPSEIGMISKHVSAVSEVITHKIYQEPLQCLKVLI